MEVGVTIQLLHNFAIPIVRSWATNSDCKEFHKAQIADFDNEPLILDDRLFPNSDDAEPEEEGNLSGHQEYLSLLQQECPTDLSANILYYMAGCAVRSVARRAKCVLCNEALFLEQPFNPFLAQLVILK